MAKTGSRVATEFTGDGCRCVTAICIVDGTSLSLLDWLLVVGCWLLVVVDAADYEAIAVCRC